MIKNTHNPLIWIYFPWRTIIKYLDKATLEHITLSYSPSVSLSINSLPAMHVHC